MIISDYGRDGLEANRSMEKKITLQPLIWAVAVLLSILTQSSSRESNDSL